MKKITALILVVSLLVLTGIPAFASPKTENDYPVIVIGGRVKSTPIYDTNGRQVNDTAVDGDFITNAVKECLPYLGKGLITGDYQPWINKVMEFYAPIYADMIPDVNGEITDGSRPKELSGDGHIVRGYYGFDDHFLYDWREDPYKSADALHRDIQLLKQTTGKDKVSIIGRCYGANVMTAYLDKYGTGDIDTLVYSVSAAAGAAAAGCCFTGSFDIDADYLKMYAENNDLFDDPVIDELFKATLSYVNSFYGFRNVESGIELILDKLFPIIAPTLLRASFASYCSFWAMVSEPYYEKAKKIVFSGVEDEYSCFIEKIDRYHELQKHLPEILSQYEKEGLNVAVVTKYNSLLSPIIERVKLQSDDTVELELASFGAVSANFGSVLPESYLNGKDEKYISPDKIIDASTCLFPERTWFIKDVPHSLITPAIARLMLDICHGGGSYTVETGEYGRFLKLDTENDILSELTYDAEKKDTGSRNKISEYFEKGIRFLKALFQVIKNLF